MRAEVVRAASLVVALASLALAHFLGTGEAFHLAVIVVVIPLGCVWYGDEIGDLVGMTANGEDGVGNIVGTLITLAGWIALFAILAIIVHLGLGRL